jgi:hypothetical protein
MSKFKTVKSDVVNCLREGRFQHEFRGSIDTKNVLSTGEISVDDVIKLILKTKGFEYECRPHHMVSGVDVHILKPDNWYIKFYFVEPDVMFISVHKN